MISKYIKILLEKASTIRYPTPDADLGYLGIARYHSNSFIPIKSSKNHLLTEEEKTYNKEPAGRRVVIEHINAKIKTFKSMVYP
jgi:hypothetical protein